ADELPDAPLVERRLIVTLGVRGREKPGERTRPGAVQLARLRLEHAGEIEPVERALGLVDELEELHRVGSRCEATVAADEADAQAHHVTQEGVVRGVTVQRLPRAVSRIVVTEAMRRLRPRQTKARGRPSTRQSISSGTPYPKPLGSVAPDSAG